MMSSQRACCREGNVHLSRLPAAYFRKAFLQSHSLNSVFIQRGFLQRAIALGITILMLLTSLPGLSRSVANNTYLYSAVSMDCCQGERSATAMPVTLHEPSNQSDPSYQTSTPSDPCCGSTSGNFALSPEVAGFSTINATDHCLSKGCISEKCLSGQCHVGSTAMLAILVSTLPLLENQTSSLLTAIAGSPTSFSRQIFRPPATVSFSSSVTKSAVNSARC